MERYAVIRPLVRNKTPRHSISCYFVAMHFRIGILVLSILFVDCGCQRSRTEGTHAGTAPQSSAVKSIGQAQESSSGRTEIPAGSSSLLNSARPLADASEILQAMYGKVVTYEEPLLTWRGDLEVQGGRDPEGKWNLFPRIQAFVMPAVGRSGTDLASALEQTIAAYHQQSSGTRFRVLSSTFGYHIVPVQVHDENGRSVPATSLLDRIVKVPSESRTAEDHLRALGAAISSAGSVPVWVLAFPYGHPHAFDHLFRYQKDEPTPYFMQSYPPFRWGIYSVVARDALVDLFNQSATTFSWRLKCQASARASDRFCALNVGVAEVAVTDSHGKPVTDSKGKLVTRGLKYDRCKDCPPAGDPLNR